MKKHQKLTTKFCLLIILFSLFTACKQKKQLLHNHVPVDIARLQLKPIGAMPDTAMMTLVIGLPLKNQDSLASLLRQLYDPANPKYRKWLSPGQFGEMFGPTNSDYQKLQDFAKEKGFTTMKTFPDHTLIELKGSVASVNNAFHVKMNFYSDPKVKRTFFAPAVEPILDIDVPILHINGLDNYVLESPPSAGSAPGGLYASQDFRAVYAANVNPTITGAGQIVGIYNPPHGFNLSDISTYEDMTGISPHVTVTKVLVDGTDAPVDNFTVEVTLDIEMAIAMAPGLAQVLVYEAGNPVTALKRMATDDLANQLSTSWIAPPQDDNANQIYMQFQAQGQSFFCASADDGAYYSALRNPANPQGCSLSCSSQTGCCYSASCTGVPCPVPQWADDPFITIVGSTSLVIGNNGTQFESASTFSGGGWEQGKGGAAKESDYPSIPYWQQGVDMTSNFGSTMYRNSPDVAMAGQNIFIVVNGQPSIGAGTSASSPLWAGFMALVNQQAHDLGKQPVGFINPYIYQIGKSADYHTYFNDITSGNNLTGWNTQPGNQNMYPAVPGYDLCTGWGTPNGTNLIDKLASFGSYQPLHATLSYRGYECDPGPQAGLKARYELSVSGGVGPLSYYWTSNNAPIVSGGTATSASATVIAPPLGSPGNLSVLITDANGAKNTATITVASLDPVIAGELHRICETIHQLEEFKHPLYINPGDPGPLDFEMRPYSRADLQKLQRLNIELNQSLRAIQKGGVNNIR